MFSVKCKYVAELLEWEQGFLLNNVGLKLTGFKPLEKKDLSKWNFLYPSDSHILHKNLGGAGTHRGWNSSGHLTSTGQESAAHPCACVSRAPCGKPVPN